MNYQMAVELWLQTSPSSIFLDGDNVTIYLDKAIGKLDRATVSGMGDDWTIANRGAVRLRWWSKKEMRPYTF